MNNLKSMLTLFGDLVAKSDTVPAEREMMVRWINTAAKAVWAMDDLPQSLRLINIADTQENVISFPEYVGLVRGIRRCRVPKQVLAQSARFINRIPENCYTPVVLNRSAVACNSADFVNLRLIFSAALLAPVTVTVVGSTTASAQQVVTKNFGVGETVKTLDTAFVSITSIQKSTVSSADMSLVSDVNDVIAEVPANALTSSYLLYQLWDDTSTCCAQVSPGIVPAFELYYKPTLRPLVNDSDMFPAEGVEDAIAYYAAFQRMVASPDDGAQKVAKGFFAQAMAILNTANRNDAIGKASPVAAVRPTGFVRFQNICR